MKLVINNINAPERINSCKMILYVQNLCTMLIKSTRENNINIALSTA
jgi:hypothetical protein